MHKSATKYNEIVGKWSKNKHGASKIIDTLETYQVFIDAGSGINLIYASANQRIQHWMSITAMRHPAGRTSHIKRHPRRSPSR
jgi:hypothetical protein